MISGNSGIKGLDSKDKTADKDKGFQSSNFCGSPQYKGYSISYIKKLKERY
jgi:hypothetical protein